MLKGTVCGLKADPMEPAAVWRREVHLHKNTMCTWGYLGKGERGIWRKRYREAHNV